MNKIENKEMLCRFIIEAGDSYLGEALRSLKPFFDNVVDQDFHGSMSVSDLNHILAQRQEEIGNCELSLCEQKRMISVKDKEIERKQAALAELDARLQRSLDSLSGIRASILQAQKAAN